MAVTPLPASDDHAAPIPTPDVKKTPELALVTGKQPQTGQAPTQANEPIDTGEPTAPQQDAQIASTDPGGMYDAVTRPRLAAVRGDDEHFVPATARYARELTDGALALRHQAIVRLGVASEASWAGVGRRVVREDLPGLPDARMWGGRLAQAVSEVLAGDRPISQLVRFTDDQVFLELNRRVRLLGLNSTAGSRGAKEKSTVRSVRVFMPEPSIAEVAAHVRRGDRSRAVALRLEIRRNRWVCTALELG